MPVDPPGSAAPKPSTGAPRRAGGPKRPPRPERSASEARQASNGADDTIAGFGAPPSSTMRVKAPPATQRRADDRPGPQSAVPGLAPLPGAGSNATARPQETAATPAPAKPAGGKAVRRGRRVKRVVRRIDLWSVLKLSLVVYTCLYAATLGTLAALWGLLYSSGSIERLQSFLEDVGLENFTFYGNQMFQACAAIGAVGVLAGTVITVLATALVNVISEMTGGIRLVVIEEDVEPRR